MNKDKIIGVTLMIIGITIMVISFGWMIYNSTK